MTQFADRHIGPNPDELRRMLDTVGYGSVEELMDAAIPEVIRWHGKLDLPAAASEAEVLAELRGLASRNTVLVSMIGLGYYGTHTPGVIRRNVLESPAWYTAYTPYQPEISQGRLEALLNFQTMVTDLTGLATANASMLDEATAAAEGMTLARRASKAASNVYLVDADTLPQTIAVIQTRAEPLGLDVQVLDLADADQLPDEFFGLHLQYPGASGAVRDQAGLVAAAHARGALVAVAADLLGLCLLRPPGEIGVDIAVGSAQRFGVPMGFGGTRTPDISRVAGRPGAVAPRSPGRGEQGRRRSGAPTASPYRPASSTSGGRRRPATSAPPRSCWP